MTMRVHKFTTHLRPEDAYMLIEYLDMLRDVLMEAYGDEITALLREASQHDLDSRGERIDVESEIT